MPDGSVLIDAKLNQGPVKKGLEGLANLLKNHEGMINAATDLGKKLGDLVVKGIEAASAGLVAAGIKSVDVGKNFDTAMSQLGATMGKTVDQIGDLSAKAQEMGATTKFTATEAAEGLNILAMAGLDAQQQIEGIGTVLDLASAGAMGLDQAASYVVGAVKGFGDEMSNATKYADMMAKGATMANTDVAGLGEALGNSAANAAAYGQAADRTTVALLRLAESNVTGSQASTMLNRAMADIYTPTDDAAKAMKKLGISAYDSKGNARDFNTVVDEMNAKLSKMSDEEKNAYLSTILTSQGLKAFNMMTTVSSEKVKSFEDGLKGCGEEFVVYEGQIYSMEDAVKKFGDRVRTDNAFEILGAAAGQARIQLDNLEGDITLFGSALDGLALSAYSTFSDTCRDIVQEGTKLLDQLTKATKEGGLQGLASALGDALATALVYIGEYVPKALELGASIIESLIDGLMRNSDQIAVIAIKIASQLGVGIMKNVPKLLQLGGKIVVSLIKGITAEIPTLIEEAAKCISELAKGFNEKTEEIKEAGKGILKAVSAGLLNALPIIQENLPEIIKAVRQFFFGKFETIKNIGVTVFSAIAEALPQIAEFCKEKLPQVMETVTALFNQYFPVVQSIGADLFGKIAEAIPSIIEKVKEYLPTIIDAVSEWASGKLEQMLSIAQFLFGVIADVIPTVIEKIKEKLPEIIETVSAFIGENLETVKGIALSLWEQISEAIPQVIGFIVEKLPEVIGAARDFFGSQLEVIKDIALSLWKGISDAIPEVIAFLADALPDIIASVSQFFGEQFETVKGVAVTLFKAIADAIPDVLGFIQENLPMIIGKVSDFVTENLPKVLDLALTLYKSFVDAIPEALQNLISTLGIILQHITTFVAENKDAIIQKAKELFAGFIDAALNVAVGVFEALPGIITEIGKFIAANVPVVLEFAKELFLTFVDAIPGIVTKLGETLPKILDAIIDFVTNSLPQLLVQGAAMLGEIVQGIADAIPKVAEKAGEIITTLLDKLKEVDWLQVGKDLLQGLVDGLGNALVALKDAIVSVFEKLWGAVKDFFGIHSPSTLAAEAGGFILDGLVNGMSSLVSSICETVKGIFGKIWDAIKSVFGFGKGQSDEAKEAKQAGQDIMSGMREGIEGEKSRSEQTIKSVSKDALDTFKRELGVQSGASTKTRPYGENLVQGISTGITQKSTTGTFSQSSSKVADAVGKALNTACGISGSIFSSGQTARKFEYIGQAICEGVAKGINANTSTIKSAAEAAAQAAYQAAKSKLGIHSPSKVFAQLGVYSGEGYAEGLEDSEKRIARSIGDITDRIADAGIVQRLQAAVAGRSGEIMNSFDGISSRLESMDSPINGVDYDSLSQAIWDNAPDMNTYLDGEKVSKRLEPSISREQAKRVKETQRRSGNATVI